LNELRDRSTEKVTEFRIAGDTGSLSQLVDQLEQLKEHILSSRQYEEQLSNHKFIDFPLFLPPNRNSKIDRLVSKLRRLRRRNRRARRAIRQWETPSWAAVADLQTKKREIHKRCQPLDNAPLEGRVRRLRESILRKKDQIQQKRKQLEDVFDWRAEPQYRVHLCDRCLHRIEEYRMGGTDWAELHEKLLVEIRQWRTSDFPGLIMLSIWNNKLEHFMKRVARPM
jgi:chromosome segregation ATPase